MARLSERRYRIHVLVAMVIYIAAMLIVWPAVHTGIPLVLKGLCALAPVVPVLYVIAMMAWRIRDSDELEQRNHLLGLGVAAAVASVLSLIGGFLALARLLPIDGSVLFWVFPVLMLSYGVTRWLVLRRYGHDMQCMPDETVPWRWRIGIFAAIVAVIGISLIFHHTDEDVSFGIGMLVGMGFVGVIVALTKRARRRRLNASPPLERHP